MAPNGASTPLRRPPLGALDRSQRPVPADRWTANVRRARRLATTAARASLYPRWPDTPRLVEGYSVLMPLPGDLPVFLDLALAGFAKQDPTGHVETLVIPDRVTRAFVKAYHRSVGRAPWGPTRLIRIGPRGRALYQIRHGPWNDDISASALSRAVRTSRLNCFLQSYYGAAAARSTHALLHDADLFLLDPGFLSKRYQRCSEWGLGWLGVERRLMWNRDRKRFEDWYEREGLGPVLSTWELMFDLRRLKSFPPWQMHGQSHRFRGTERDFDSMDYVQVRTPPEGRGLWEAPDDYAHFNWAISSYRLFQESAGQPFIDERFRILLIRLLSDAFGHGDASHQLPSAKELARGIDDDHARVTYRAAGIDENYQEFRREIGRVIASPLVDPARAEDVERALLPFDFAFA